MPPSRGPEPLAGPEYRIAAQFRLDAGGRLQPAVPAAPAATIAEAARLYRARDHDAAAGVCAAILAADPRHFDALHLRGVLHLEAKRADDALVWLRQAAQERPDDPQVLFHLGFALLTLQRHDEAEAALQRARAGRPQDFDTLNNLGSAVAAQGRHAEAIGWFRLALALRPDAPPALFNLGRALLQCDAVEDAVPVLRAALAAAPAGTERQRRIDLHTTLNEALIRACRYREALAVLRAAPADVADAPAIVWNESLTLLMLGDYAAGWPKYECRFLVPDHDAPRPGAVTLALDAVAGRRVLVFPEQGRGDMLQFARYLPLLAARGAQVLVETYAELRPLFAEIDGVSTVVTPDEPPPPHDLQTALLSLPAAFATTLETIPAAVPYLRVPPAYAARWQAALGPRPAPHAGPSAGPSAGPPHAGPQMGPQMGPQHAGPQHVGAQHVGPQVGPPASARQAEPRVGPQAEPRVGLAWWGAQQIPRRSLPLAQLAPVLAVPGIAFHALQKELTDADRATLATQPALAAHDAALADYADTAALIAQLDLVISIDTSVAHLAGGLGVPVWVMLPHSPDWRWLEGRPDSPWYPSARLFRQAARGDWDGVVARVAAALADWALRDRALADRARDWTRDRAGA